MKKRGPDGSGEWWSTNRRVALAHRRLSIVDLSDRASQPMLNADGSLTITFNGEIYNHKELRKELELEGVSFRTNSDTEVLLHLYSRLGTSMVQKLRGMFAFAIWDQHRGGIFLARDLYGIKPLYTANDGWTFRFASQVKALLAGSQISRDPEPAGLVGFYLWGSIPEPFTLYRDIRQLPAGHYQWVDASGPHEALPYASIPSILAAGATNPTSAAESKTLATAAIRHSVHAHLIADVEVGLFLSSGIDSCAILGLMRDYSHQQIRSITLVFDEFENTSENEAPLARKIAAFYGSEHFTRRVTKQEFEQDLPKILDAMDQPSIDGVNTWFVSKAANEIGLKVALSGVGGDELFAGYDSFSDIPNWVSKLRYPAKVPGLGILARQIAKSLGLSSTRPKARSMLEFGGSYPGAYLLRRGLYMPHEIVEILGSPMTKDGLRRLAPLVRIGDMIQPDPGSAVGRICALESSAYLRCQLLRDADWAGMAHSIEIRTPLVDSELLRSIAPAIPSLSPRTGKLLLAEAPSIPLPEAIVTREKTGFGVPTNHWSSNSSSATMNKKGLSSRSWASTVYSAYN